MMYNKEYFDNIKFKTNWSPSIDFYKNILKDFMDLTIKENSWYDNDKARQKLKDSLTRDQFNFIWNNYKDLREGLIDSCVERNRHSRYSSDSAPIKEYGKDVLSFLYDKIPVDFETDSNRLRAKYCKHCDEDFDYLNELTRARLLGKEDLVSIWSSAGMSSSKDNSFYEFLWDNIKREKGSVEKRMSIIDACIGNYIFSEKILSHCAKRGTKRVKRLAVDRLSDNLRYAKRRDDDALSEKIENALLLFATTDDANVVDILTETLSVENLPWVMPSASKFPWLLSRINRRIEYSRE